MVSETSQGKLQRSSVLDESNYLEILMKARCEEELWTLIIVPSTGTGINTSTTPPCRKNPHTCNPCYIFLCTLPASRALLLSSVAGSKNAHPNDLIVTDVPPTIAVAERKHSYLIRDSIDSSSSSQFDTYSNSKIRWSRFS